MNPVAQRTLPLEREDSSAADRVAFDGALRVTGRWLAAPFAANAVLLLVLAAYLLAVIVIERVTGLPVTTHVRGWQWLSSLETIAGLWLFAAALSVSGFGIFRLWRMEQTRRRGTELADLRSAWRPFGRVIDAGLRIAVCFFALSLFFKAFLGVKAALPFLYPFAWDSAFIQLDLALHGGYHPWRLLQPLFGYPVVTRTVDLLYYLWFPLNFAILLWYAAQEDGVERRRFFAAYLAMWVLLGSAAAIAFSSAGPCFLGVVTGESTDFLPLMEYLRSVHADQGLYAIAIQDALVERYLSAGFQPFEGISAMPSLHVAAAVLFVLVMRERSRLLAALFAAYAVVIMIGSVHLGWHYAVDGYASAAAVGAIWWATGRLIRGRYSGTGSVVR